MKIHFCDLCNESVPQADLDSGRARLVKGRVICSTCERAMSHADGELGDDPQRAGGGQMGTAVVTAPVFVAEPVAHAIDPRLDAPAPPAPRSTEPAPALAAQPVKSSSGAAWIAALAILFTALAIFVTDDRLHDLAKRQADLSTDVAHRGDIVRGVQSDVQTLTSAQDALEKRMGLRITAEAQQTDQVKAQLEAGQAESKRLREQIQALVSDVAQLHEERTGNTAALDKRINDLAARVTKDEDERRALAAKLADIAANPAPVAAAPAAGAAPAAAPEWTKRLNDLKSTDESVRWEAVTALAATKDPAVVPHITEALHKDTSFFVRMGAARVLGEMGARAAIPDLIDALEDSEPAAREQAWIALHAITGKDFKFDPYAVEAERAKKVKAWRDWLKKEGESGG